MVLSPSEHLLVGGLDASTPVWSPTGEHLAFLLHDSLGAHVGIYDFGSGTHRVVGDTTGSDAGAFSWSPDGTRLAYAGPDVTGDGRGAINIYDVATGESKPLAAGSSPRFKGDGSILAECGPDRPQFAADSDEAEGATAESGGEGAGSCRIDVATGEVSRTDAPAQRVSNESPFPSRFAVSPDGKRIAYETLTDGKKPGGLGKREIWLTIRQERP